MSHLSDIAIGAGAWGTALAILAHRVGNNVTLWTRNQQVIDAINRSRINEVYLPDVYIDPQLKVTDQLSDLRQSEVILLAVPAQHLRAQCIALSDLIPEHVPLVICAKGIERGSLMFMHEVVHSVLPRNPVAILSGPNFAKEAANSLPTATILACQDQHLGNRLVHLLGGKFFRPYLTDDMISVAIGGALKNVIAIACGIAAGANLGENAQAAIITRGLAEMTRLAGMKGGRAETMMGLAGMGDLVLTCKSTVSRNYSFGLRLGLGLSVEEVLSTHRGGVIEGVETAESAHDLSAKQLITMPICTAVHEILQGQKDVQTAINQLLERPFTTEQRSWEDYMLPAGATA
jgi:glycerol-3-phosphate dehydrogenase (NAD(P)+)